MCLGGSWLVMGGVLLVALAIGLQPDDTARTPEDRVFEVAEGYKCPTCRSQSVADSEAPSAKAIRAEIARRLEAGQSEDQIRDYLVGRFGEEILLTPSASGVTGAQIRAKWVRSKRLTIAEKGSAASSSTMSLMML